MGTFVDLHGRRFGRLEVIARHVENSRHQKAQWECLCDCGTTKVIDSGSLVSGKTLSCGCYHRERTAEVGRSIVTHGMKNSSEYNVWNHMRQRCNNPNNISYSNYGGRGITVCDRWLNSFEAFYADMGPRPSAEHSIERRDVNGHYEPSNCYWATNDIQQNNRRNNVHYEFEGDKLTAAQISRRTGIERHRVGYRMDRGLDPQLPMRSAATAEFEGESLEISEISHRTGISPDGVRYRLEHGQSLTVKSNRPTTNQIPSKEILIVELAQLSFNAIGKKRGVSGTTVRNWCKRFGIFDVVRKGIK